MKFRRAAFLSALLVERMGLLSEIGAFGEHPPAFHALMPNSHVYVRQMVLFAGWS